MKIKMKRLTAIIMAGCMALSLVIPASAATKTFTFNDNMTLKEDGTGDYFKPSWEIAGAAAAKDGTQIDHSLIKKLRFTFVLTGFDCMADAANPCKGECIGYAINNYVTNWKDYKGCYANPAAKGGVKDGDKAIFTVDLEQLGWPQMNGADIDDYLQASVAFWAYEKGKGMGGTCDIDVLDKDGNVLALGAKAPESTSAATSGNSSTQPSGGGTTTTARTTAATVRATQANNNSGNNPINTGVGGVMAFGGMAILAAGAVIISRKKKV